MRKERKNIMIMEKFTVSTNEAMYAGTNINNVDCHEDTLSTNETRELPDNYSIFSLYLQENTAGLFCSYGDITTYVKETENICFLPENGVIFFNISYKQGLHILKCLGYEKVSASFSPFDACIDDDTSTQAIYYQEDWKRIQ